MIRCPCAAITALAVMAGLSGCQTPSGTTPHRADPTVRPLEKDPRSAELYLSLIAQLNGNGEYYAALAHIDEFERLYGKTPRAAMLRGDALVDLGDLPNAEAAYTSIPDGVLPGDKQYGLGRVAAARSNWHGAVSYLEAAVAQQPTNVRFLNDLGCALYRVGRTEDALFALYKARELGPADAEVRYNLSVILAERGRSEERGGGNPSLSRSPASAGKPPSLASDRSAEATVPP
jgi:tight adherence protein D